MSSDAKFLTKQDFVTFTLYGDVKPNNVTPDEYQPIHENGNLFSYPTAVGNIENYNYKKNTLTDIQSTQFSTTATDSGVSFSKLTTNEKTESTKVEKGYLSQALSLVDGLLGTDFAKVPAGEKTPTFTREQRSSEQIKFNLPNADSLPLLNAYNIEYQAYTADNGAITDKNKTWANINFTPDPATIPANKPGEHYQLYAEIDSEGKITEVHEKRDENKDPGGNNEGYFGFTVEDLNSAAASRAMLIQKVRSSAAGEDSIIMPEMTLNGKAKWADFYDEYIAGTDGSVNVDIVIENKMPYTLPDTEFKITYFDPANDNNIESAVYGKRFILFPNETYEISVVIDDDFADKLREVGRDNTFGGYTAFWLDDLLKEINGEDYDFLEDDEDHEPEVLSSDEYPEDDSDKYVQRVITQTWTLTNEEPAQ